MLWGGDFRSLPLFPAQLLPLPSRLPGLRAPSRHRFALGLDRSGLAQTAFGGWLACHRPGSLELGK